MNAVVITHSSSFEPRAEMIGHWLKEKGAEVTWIYSDFDHIKKTTVPRKAPDHVFLHLKPYSRNLSVARLMHIDAFAKEVGRYLAGRPIDLLYVILPANSLAGMAEKLKKETGARVVFDIVDLWPESLPIDHVQNLPPMQIWKNRRDRHLDCADWIFTECALYRDLLDLPVQKTATLYWCAEAEESRVASAPGKPQRSCDTPARLGDDLSSAAVHQNNELLEIAYVGSINYIIDIDHIAELLTALCQRIRVRVHVIGEGETKDDFLEAIRGAGAEAIDHGAIYDKEKKAEIFAGCAFGLNFMVPLVKVGLTMKSLDYLACGLPLLNNIPGDTWDLVEEYDAGVNVPRGDLTGVTDEILAMAKDPRAGEDAIRLYRETFTRECFFGTLETYLKPVLTAAAEQRSSMRTSGISAKSGGEEEGGSGAKARPQPAISVALAACNGERYIREQLESILAQLDATDEVIVSVDPSEDGTFPLVCEMVTNDARIRVLEGPGGGVQKNIEHALRHCSGKRIFLSDQDDIWLPGKVEKVSRALQQDMLVLHDARMVDADLNELAPSFMQWRRSRKGLVANLWRNSYIGCCMAFRRELLEKALPFPEDLPMHDQWLGLMAEKHGSVRMLRMPLILYRRHEDTATNDRHAGVAQMLQWRTKLIREVARR